MRNKSARIHVLKLFLLGIFVTTVGCSRLFNLNFVDSEYLFRRALKLEAMGGEQKTLKAWKKAVKANLKNGPLGMQIGLLMMSPGVVAQILHELTNKVEKSEQNSPEALIDRGFIFASFGAFKLAEQDFSRLLVLNEELQDARFYRGVVRYLTQNNTGVVEDMDRIINSDKKTFIGDALFYRGLAKLKIQKDAKSAYDDLNKAIELADDKKKFYKMKVDQLQNHHRGRYIRVNFSIFEIPECSVWTDDNDNGEVAIRSIYLIRGIQSILFMWEIQW